jgi:hypothetical protein
VTFSRNIPATKRNKISKLMKIARCRLGQREWLAANERQQVLTRESDRPETILRA